MNDSALITAANAVVSRLADLPWPLIILGFADPEFSFVLPGD